MVTTLSGNIVDVVNNTVFPGEITISKNRILEVVETGRRKDFFILPGLVDAHIHVESSLLTPNRFGEAVVRHGTVSVVTDPHEIANVLGIRGIDYMMRSAAVSPIKIFFTAPSCVPATRFETSGATLGPSQVGELLRREEVVALGEVMDYKAVLAKEKDVMEKIEAAKRVGKPVDGHCPGLSGDDLERYVGVGITTDHESTSLEEAFEKVSVGMRIMIREGSTARNMEDLIPVALENPGQCFLVGDDLSPTSLVGGHVDSLLRKAVSLGVDPLDAVKMVSINPVKHYNLPVGLLRPGDPADIVIVDNLKNFGVLEVWVDGEKVVSNKELLKQSRSVGEINFFVLESVNPDMFTARTWVRSGSVKTRVIKVLDGQITTKQVIMNLKVVNHEIQPDLERDVIKLAVVERYGHGNVANCFVHGLGLSRGAIASSVSHDSHNIVVAGANKFDMAKAVNTIRTRKGGLVVVLDGKILEFLELPVAGLMSEQSLEKVLEKVEELNRKTKTLGCALGSPLTTLSFLTLLVVPELKVSDKGLFDAKNFSPTELVVTDKTTPTC